MTKEEIIELAYKATESEIILGTLYEAIKVECVNIYLMSFAKLVAEKEREECAKASEEVIFKVKPIYCVVAENCVKVIRARGQE